MILITPNVGVPTVLRLVLPPAKKFRVSCDMNSAGMIPRMHDSDHRGVAMLLHSRQVLPSNNE